MSTTSPNKEYLSEEFVNLVAQDVRGLLSTRDQQRLYSDENLDRYYDALISLKNDVEVQLTNHKSRLVQKQHELALKGDDGSLFKAYLSSPEYHRADGSPGPSPVEWRAKAIKFLKSVEDHIAAAKARRRLRSGSPAAAGRQDDVLAELREAILEHKEEISEDEASEADLRLWKLVEAAGNR